MKDKFMEDITRFRFKKHGIRKIFSNHDKNVVFANHGMNSDRDIAALYPSTSCRR
ncbi:MAG: hypothetical protein SWO11_20980 [Thermodesulfobacteriota bacterium]|nr:hypothetical protein [Thermodesulfobacteriota bacterium]